MEMVELRRKDREVARSVRLWNGPGSDCIPWAGSWLSVLCLSRILRTALTAADDRPPDSPQWMAAS